MVRHPKDQISVCFALIHNNNIERTSYLQPNLDELQKRMKEKFVIVQLQVSSQPALIPHRTCMAIWRSFLYMKLYREWCRYRLLRPPSWFLLVPHFFVQQVKKYVVQKDLGAQWNRRSFVETVVTDKHIRAWHVFVETGCDYLVCFEDDAVFRDNSIQRLEEFLDDLSRSHFDSLVYADLAGGCDLAELRISNLEVAVTNGFRYYQKPVTNTACVYLVSKQLVAKFLEELVREPWLRLIGIDWMMNALFMTSSRHGLKVFCAHADPTIFAHGSTTGSYLSWQATY